MCEIQTGLYAPIIPSQITWFTLYCVHVCNNKKEMRFFPEKLYNQTVVEVFWENIWKPTFEKLTI